MMMLIISPLSGFLFIVGKRALPPPAPSCAAFFPAVIADGTGDAEQGAERQHDTPDYLQNFFEDTHAGRLIQLCFLFFCQERDICLCQKFRGGKNFLVQRNRKGTETRQEILDAARRLFNQRGYNGVSLQDIARSVGISKGNLSYHFQKKEGIAEALIAEGGDPLPLKTPQTIGELDLVFLDIQQVVQDNRFFFLSHAQLGQI